MEGMYIFIKIAKLIQLYFIDSQHKHGRKYKKYYALLV